MAHYAMWYNTNLPENLIDSIIEELEGVGDEHMQESIVGQGENGSVVTDIRNSKNIWLPADTWVGQLLFSYVQRANKENFLYDIDHIESDTLQYTKYGIGEYYKWHNDMDISTSMAPLNMNMYSCEHLDLSELKVNIQSEKIRKLSFSLQLSDPDDYEGGNLQMMHGSEMRSCFAPRIKGSLTIFDSRVFHRVLKVTKGVRRSLVGWVVGPRWR